METYDSSPQLRLEYVEILPSDHPRCYSEERLCMILKTRVVKFKKGNRFVFTINYKDKVKLSPVLK